jgi:hypothetical protein
MPGQAALAYSFGDFQGNISGPGGTINIGSGAGVSDEGITVEFIEETNTMRIGADGSVSHSLHVSRAGKIHLRLLKVSLTNQLLMQMYNFQRTSSINHGQNLLNLTNTVTGDNYSCRQVAFAKAPPNTYAKEAGTIEWEFDAGRIDATLGGAGLLIT